MVFIHNTNSFFQKLITSIFVLTLYAVLTTFSSIAFFYPFPSPFLADTGYAVIASIQSDSPLVTLTGESGNVVFGANTRFRKTKIHLQL
jgi:hypothetical protein